MTDSPTDAALCAEHLQAALNALNFAARQVRKARDAYPDQKAHEAYNQVLHNLAATTGHLQMLRIPALVFVEADR